MDDTNKYSETNNEEGVKVFECVICGEGYYIREDAVDCFDTDFLNTYRMEDSKNYE